MLGLNKNNNYVPQEGEMLHREVVIIDCKCTRKFSHSANYQQILLYIEADIFIIELKTIIQNGY